MKNLKFGWKYYFSPTPKRLKVLGNSLAAAGTFAAGITALNGQMMVGTILMCIAVIGKFISEFFTEDSQEKQEE